MHVLNAPPPAFPAPDGSPGKICVSHFADRYNIGFMRAQKRHYQLRQENRDGTLSIVYYTPESLEQPS